MSQTGTAWASSCYAARLCLHSLNNGGHCLCRHRRTWRGPGAWPSEELQELQVQHPEHERLRCPGARPEKERNGAPRDPGCALASTSGAGEAHLQEP